MKEDIIYLKHILQAIGRVEEYTKGLSNEAFHSSNLIQDGVIRQLEIIGEATKQLSPAITIHFVHIDWKDIAGMRDKLIHHYMGVDLNTVWDTVQEDIPVFKQEVVKIVQHLQ
ncbi:MAG: DUF86 domain-containing protein [Bacteroidetes bacterium]|nr:MAG: DUF86 domain-containing protein [Bacteroidota bacterium]